MSLAGTLARKGAAVTFSRTTPGVYDGLTGFTAPPTTTTISGSAMEIEGDSDLLLTLGLIASDTQTLLFRPATAGTLPALEWDVVWGGATLTVKHIQRLAMAGTPTAAKIVVAR